MNTDSDGKGYKPEEQGAFSPARLIGTPVGKKMRPKFRFLMIPLLVVAFVLASVGAALMQTAPTLGTAASFGVLGGSTVTNTGPTVIEGDLGVAPGLAVTGFPPGIVLAPSAIHQGDAVALQAQSDLTVAYDALAGQACTGILTGLDLGGLTLTSGVYCFDSSAQLTGQLTLDLEGDPNAVFVFKIASTLTTAPNSSIIFVNGSESCNVYWQVGSSATLDTGTQFAGNILALSSISLNTGADVRGRVLARNGAVTMQSNTISKCIDTPEATNTLLPATQTVAAATQTALAPTLTAIALTPTPTIPPSTQTAIAAMQTVAAATQTALVPTLTAIALTPLPTLPQSTQTAIAATQTVIAATRIAVAPTLTAIAMTPIPLALEENDQPAATNHIYFPLIGR